MTKKKTWFAAAALGVTCSTVGVMTGSLLAGGAGTPKPEIDRASATIGLQGTLTSVTCNGEDKVATTGKGTPYITYRGTWIGSEGQITPDNTDYGLSGPLTVSGIVWTINTLTDRGVLTGKVSLAAPTGAKGNTYAGTLTLVTQGLPSSAAPAAGRGWIRAAIALPDETESPGDDALIANVEFPSLTSAGASGAFGDDPGTLTPPSVSDFSVVTNLEACP